MLVHCTSTVKHFFIFLPYDNISLMTHAEVSEFAIRWFNEQPQYKGWVMIPNRSGQAEYNTVYVPYGIPPGGGGSDFILFGSRLMAGSLGGGVFTCEFLEIKTIAYPTLSRKQKRWLKIVSNMGAACWIFRETRTEPGYEVVGYP